MKHIIAVLVLAVLSITVAQAEECKAAASACKAKASACEAKAKALKTAKANSGVKGAQQLVKR